MKKNPMKKGLWQIVGLLLLAMLFLGVQITSAQDPIALDELKSGELTAANPVASYRFTVTAGQNLQIEVLAVTEGIVPTFTLRREDASLGVWYALSPENTLTDRVAFTDGGEYIIQIGSTTPAEGQFVVTLTEVIPPPTLALSTPTSGLLTGGQTQTYQVNATDAPLLLDVRGLGLLGALSDDDGNVIASFSDQLAGGFFNIITPGQYLIEISNNTSNTSLTYEVVLTRPGETVPSPAQTEDPGAVIEATGTSAVEFDASGRPILPEAGACILATLNNVRVNVRTGPSSNNPIESTISQFEAYPVTGRNGDRTWFQIDYGEGEDWVAITVARLGGNCENVPFVDAPIAPPPPTATPTPIPVTPVPTATSRSLDPSLGTGDADGDGIQNDQDFCPFVSGVGNQFGGVSGADGCPVDSDSDGVNDGVDQCPFAGGPANNNGCP